MPTDRLVNFDNLHTLPREVSRPAVTQLSPGGLRVVRCNPRREGLLTSRIRSHSKRDVFWSKA